MLKKKSIIINLFIIFLFSLQIACKESLIILFNEKEETVATPDPHECKISDVVLLLDSTSSMWGYLDSVKKMLAGTIIPGLSNEIADVEIGIATFADFGEYYHISKPSDKPLIVYQTMTDDLSTLQLAVNSIAGSHGDDWPESYIEALYLMSTNEAMGSSFSPQICGPGKQGAMCFRENSSRIIIVITDAPTHEGPGGSFPYKAGIAPKPHTYDQAINALKSTGGHVLGMKPSIVADPFDDLEHIARDTGGVDENGVPIVINITNSVDTGKTVVEAIKDFCFVD